MSSLPQSYLETEILTAPPQKLQLMMIEAAIRFGRRAAGHWQAGEDERACEALIRAQKIVTELVNGLNRDESPELAGKMAAVYLFVFRRLMEASYQRDRQKLDDALGVLEIERETWRQVCRRVGRASGSDTPAILIVPSVSDATARFSLDA